MKSHLVSDNSCKNINLYCMNLFLHGMKNNVRFTIGVGDTTWAIYNQY